MNNFLTWILIIYFLFCVALFSIWINPDSHLLADPKWQCTKQRQVSSMPDEYKCSQFTYIKD